MIRKHTAHVLDNVVSIKCNYFLLLFLYCDNKFSYWGEWWPENFLKPPKAIMFGNSWISTAS